MHSIKDDFRDHLEQQKKRKPLKEEEGSGELGGILDSFSSADTQPDTDKKAKKKDDWNYLSFYVDTANKMTDSEEKFKELCALYSIAVVTGPNWYYIDSSVDPRYYEYADKTYLNIGACGIGKSGFARKSYTIGKILVKYILRPILKLISDPNKPSKKVSQFIPVDVTLPYLVRSAAGREVVTGSTWQGKEIKRCVFTQINPEYSTVVEQMVKKHNIGMFQVLSMFLSGESYYKGTLTDGAHTVENPYFNMFIGVQEHYPSILPPSVWTQGFPNRFLYVIDDYGLTYPYKGTRTDRKRFSREYPYSRLKLIRTWLNELQKVEGRRVFRAEPNTEAYKLFKDFDEEIFKIGKKPQTHRFITGYLGRLPEYAIKLACMHNISKKSIKTLEQEDLLAQETSNNLLVIPLTTEDVRWGIKQARFYLDQFKKLVDLFLKRSYLKSVPSHKAHFIKVYESIDIIYIKKKKKAWVSKSEILRKTGMTKNDIDRVLDDLVLGEFIKRKVEKAKTKRRNVFKPIIRPKFD